MCPWGLPGIIWPGGYSSHVPILWAAEPTASGLRAVHDPEPSGHRQRAGAESQSCSPWQLGNGGHGGFLSHRATSKSSILISFSITKTIRLWGYPYFRKPPHRYVLDGKARN